MGSGSPGLSPHARSQLAVLEEARRKWEHIQSLIEQATARQSGQFHDAPQAGQGQRVKNLVDQIRRSATDVSQLLAERKLPMLAQEVEQLIVLARPAPSVNRATLSGLREVAKSVWTGIEVTQAEVRRKDREDSGNQ